MLIFILQCAIWRFPYCTAPKRYFFYQPLTNGSQNGVSKKKEPVYWTIERSIYRLYLAFAIIPTRSCQKFSKQICLWNLAQGIGIIFIIQIVGAIWFFVAMVLPAVEALTFIPCSNCISASLAIESISQFGYQPSFKACKYSSNFSLEYVWMFL